MEAVQPLVHAARNAQREWAARPLRERLGALRRLRGLIARHAQDLCRRVDASHPRGPGETLAAEVLPLAEACRFLERRAPRLLRPRREPTSIAPGFVTMR